MAERKRNSNGLGHTYKVGNSYKTVIQRQGRIYTATAPTAQESRRRAKKKAEERLPKAAPKMTIETLGDYLDRWLENDHKQNIAHTTYLRYRSLLQTHIKPSIGQIELSKISPRSVASCLSTMRENGQSIRSQQQARALLSIALADAENLEIIESNPVRKVKNPQGQSKGFTPLSLEEIKRLLKTFDGTYLAARLHLALLCGLRQGEALGLRWSNVDLDNGTIHIAQQIQYVDRKPTFTELKTNRSKRTIVLTSGTAQALRIHWEIITRWKATSAGNWNDWDLVFPSETGMPRSPKIDYDQWQNALKLCGIAPRRLHDARHSAATLMYASGVGIETISRSLGHSTSAITSKLYVHTAEQPLRIAAELVEQALAEV